jgi:hypothetical protein
MSPVEIGSYAILALVALIYIGMPIGVTMLAVSFAGVALIRNEAVATRMLGAVANDSLQEYLFAVVPLFVLMGLLVTVSNVGKDTFDVFQRLLRRVAAGLGIATVAANAVFASITGVSIASATVFARVAVPADDGFGTTALAVRLPFAWPAALAAAVAVIIAVHRHRRLTAARQLVLSYPHAAGNRIGPKTEGQLQVAADTPQRGHEGAAAQRELFEPAGVACGQAQFVVTGGVFELALQFGEFVEIEIHPHIDRLEPRFGAIREEGRVAAQAQVLHPRVREQPQSGVVATGAPCGTLVLTLVIDLR